MSFDLFDRTPHAWAKVDQWSSKPREYEERTAFALFWSLSVHDKGANDARFRHGVSLIEREAGDARQVRAVLLPSARCKRPRNSGPGWRAVLTRDKRSARAPTGAVRGQVRQVCLSR
jgi:hypothetical protein